MGGQKSNRNELEIGPFPGALRALRRFSPDHLNHYLEEYRRSVLRPVISRRLGIPEDRIGLYYGLEDFFRMLFGGLCSGNDVVLTNVPHYAFYDAIAKLKGVRLATFMLNKGAKTFSFDVDDCIRHIRSLKPRVVLITSPNNPSGNVIAPQEMKRILRAAPKSSLVLLDEAYIGFQRNYDKQAFLRMVNAHPNFMLLRTFSKDFGLAGLRLAYTVCGKRAMAMLHDEQRDLGLSRVHEEVGIAALKDSAFRKKAVYQIQRERDRFISEVRTLTNFIPYDSEANFVLVECSSERRCTQLVRCQETLPVVLVKPYGGYFVRVTIGRKRDVDALLKLMRTLDA